MRKLILLLLALIVLSSFSIASTSYVVEVNYPKSVYWGQNFTITFSLATTLINSTNFQYVTPGTKLINVSNYTAYQGFGSYWVIDKVNITNASTLIVSFQGKIVGAISGVTGIVLYSSNFSLTSRDGQTGNYEILTSWDGSLWLDKLNSWHQVLSTLPTFASGNYTVIFTRNGNGTVCVYSIIINGTTYLVKYDTEVPWNSIGYVGIRTDFSTILPLKFYVISNGLIASIPAYYVVYINGKEYTSGYGIFGNITIKLYTPAIINITYPAYGVYKVITVSLNEDANIKQQFSIIQITLIAISVLLIGISIWREMRR